MYKALIVLCIFVSNLQSGCTARNNSDQVTQLTVPGSGACEQVLGMLASEFNARHPGFEVIVPKSIGTTGGIKAVKSGVSPLGRVGRPLKENEVNAGLTFLPIAYDAVVFAVGKGVGVRQLSSGQLSDVFSGKITDWHQLGGSQGPVRVLIRQADETSLKSIRRNLASFKDLIFSDQAKMAYHDYEMVALLNKFPKSIGFLTMSSVTALGNSMQPIGIDHIHPTAENLNSGRYPLKATYGMIYQKERLDSLAVEFLSFIFSEKGRRIISELGLIPIPRSS